MATACTCHAETRLTGDRTEARHEPIVMDPFCPAHQQIPAPLA